MASKKNLKKAQAFKRMNSRDVDTNVWPLVSFHHGNIGSYVRIKRHGIWWLIFVMKNAHGDVEDVIGMYKHFHHECYKIYHHMLIDLNTPFLSGPHGNVPFAYYDENQEEETDRLSLNT